MIWKIQEKDNKIRLTVEYSGEDPPKKTNELLQTYFTTNNEGNIIPIADAVEVKAGKKYFVDDGSSPTSMVAARLGPP